MEEFHNRELPFKQVSGHDAAKCVKNPSDMETWQRSEAYYNILGFINGISTAIQGIRISEDIYVSPTMKKLIAIFDKLNAAIDEIPPFEQPQRFGNKAFRNWSRKMNHDIFLLLKNALPQEKCELFSELGYYLSESFGNSVRIDYGTGHELSFLFFMCALFKADILKEEDNVASALRLFNTYLIFVRRLQTTYRMEPAGSQGVWSLDDYQFVPFIWGSAQLAMNAPFDPPKFLDENIINEYKNDFMFIGCIDYICQVKTGHFAEHSNQLWSISAVPSWVKINSGLVRMYQKEILSKFPIIQHTLFGQLMPFKAVKHGTTVPNPRLGFAPKTQTSSTVSRSSMSPPRSSSLRIIVPAADDMATDEQQKPAGERQPDASADNASEAQSEKQKPADEHQPDVVADSTSKTAIQQQKPAEENKSNAEPLSVADTSSTEPSI